MLVCLDEAADECLWQVSRTGTAAFVLRDANFNVVGLLDESGAVLQQYDHDPYGSVIGYDQLGAWAHNRIGFQGLFADRFDVDAPQPELRPGADIAYNARNRDLRPDLGRWVQRDPNGSGQPLVGNSGCGVPPSAHVAPFDQQESNQDGSNLYVYLGMNPLGGHDPSGLFIDSFLPDPTDIITGGLEALVTDYAANLDFDVEWALNWGLPDDDHSRLDSGWIKLALGRGVYDSFWVGIPGTDIGLNPLDAFGSIRGGKASKGGRRGKVRAGETIRTRRGRAAHNDYEEALRRTGIRGSKWRFNTHVEGVGRPDAINFEEKMVRELKPNTPSGRYRGARQLLKYLGELEAKYGDPAGTWTGYLDLYDAL